MSASALRDFKGYRLGVRILQGCIDGKSIMQAGQALGVSYSSARSYVKQVKRLFGASDVFSLAYVMIKQGVITPQMLPDRFYITDREIEVIKTLVRGYRVAGTARRLGIRESVVRWHLQEMKTRAGAETVPQLIGFMCACSLL